MDDTARETRLTDSLLDELMKQMPPRELHEYECRFGVYSFLRGQKSVDPPASTKAAYERYPAGEKEALNNLRAELRKLEQAELFDHVRKMTVQEKRSLLLQLGTSFLRALHHQRAERLHESLPMALVEDLLADDIPIDGLE